MGFLESVKGGRKNLGELRVGPQNENGRKYNTRGSDEELDEVQYFHIAFITQ